MRLAHFRFSAAFAVSLAGAWLAAIPVLAALSFDPRPNEIILYQDFEFTEEIGRWSLPQGQAYLLIKEIGDAASTVGALAVGANLGALLFTLPHFASKDDRCGPRVGSDPNPGLWWLGMTTEPVPAQPAIEKGSVYHTELRSPQYRSLIVYRRDLGPPPGALFLERRIYYNRSCAQLSHSSYYNRVFVPADPEVGKAVCFNLAAVSQSSIAGADTPKLKRVSDLYLLAPRHLSPDYWSVSHAFEVSLFDEENCAGSSKRFASEDKVNRAFTIQDYGLFGRVRSARIVYGGGAMAGYQAGEPVLAAAAMEFEQTTEPEPLTTAVGPDLDAKPEGAAIEETEPNGETKGADDRLVSTNAAASSPPDSAYPEPDTPLEEEPDRQAVEERSVEQAGDPAGTAGQAPTEDNAETIQMATDPPAPKVQKSLQPRAAEPALEAAPSAKASETNSLDVEIDSALTEPETRAPQEPGPASPDKDTPETVGALPGEEQAEPKSASELFRFPVIKSRRLNYCYRWGNECGEPAAAAFCKEEGYARARRWKRDAHIGALFPTIVLGDDRVCDKFLCDGFEEILCSQE